MMRVPKAVALGNRQLVEVFIAALGLAAGTARAGSADLMYVVDDCDSPLEMSIEASEPIFAGELVAEGYSCASGILVDWLGEDEVDARARIAIRRLQAGAVEVWVEDARQPTLARYRAQVPIGGARSLESTVGPGDLRITAEIRDVAHPGLVAINASYVTVDVVAMDVARIEKLKVHGLDLLDSSTPITFQFDAIAAFALMMLVADVSDLDVRQDDTGAITFAKRTSPESTTTSPSRPLQAAGEEEEPEG